MEATEVPVVESKQFRTREQVIRPANIDELCDYLRAMEKVMREKKFTGRVVIDYNTGGRRRITSHEIESEIVDYDEES